MFPFQSPKTTLLTSSDANIYLQLRILMFQSLELLSCQSKAHQDIIHQMCEVPGRQPIVET